MSIRTIRELFHYNAWANDKLIRIAAGLDDAQLDLEFEMGMRTLRETLKHIYSAERIGHTRLQGDRGQNAPDASAIHNLSEISAAMGALTSNRAEWLETLTTHDAARFIELTTSDGAPHRMRLDHVLFHVYNHGVHHRAQALNILHGLGIETPGLDYLFMRCERPTIEIDATTRAHLREMGTLAADKPAEPARFEASAFKTLFAYGDWAAIQMIEATATLDDEALDEPFDMGLGTLRKTLLHMQDAEQWWRENWTSDVPRGFEKLETTTTIGELHTLFKSVAAKRNAYIADCSDEELLREVKAEVRPDLIFTFRLGESMLQVCEHGTHHRAQALNMLRHIGASVPQLELHTWSKSIEGNSEAE